MALLLLFAGDGQAAAQGDRAAAAHLNGGRALLRRLFVGTGLVGSFLAAAATELLREAGEEFFKGAQVAGAAEEVVEHFVFDVRHQRLKEFVGLGLVFLERIFLRERAEMHAVAEAVHVIKVILPEPVYGENNSGFMLG